MLLTNLKLWLKVISIILTHTHTHTHIHEYTHSHTHTHMHAYTHSHAYIHSYTHTYTLTYVHKLPHTHTLFTDQQLQALPRYSDSSRYSACLDEHFSVFVYTSNLDMTVIHPCTHIEQERLELF